MKRIILFLVCICWGLFLAAQSNWSQFKKNSVEKLGELMAAHYVFEDAGMQIKVQLHEKLKSGYFDQYNDLDAFVESLNAIMQAINKDKHLQVVRPPQQRPARGGGRDGQNPLLAQINNIRNITISSSGFKEAKRLDGNIGYVNITRFALLNEGGPLADSYMRLLNEADALIIDLRMNGGGDPDMVKYLCSYFFDKKTHLNSIYWRAENKTNESWTLDKVNGKKMTAVPIFILTSKETFSAAEEFCYDLQAQKRATVIGEVTGGGANPGRGFPLNDSLGVFIPVGRSINPVTKTNWEGAGIQPDVVVEASAAFDKAVEIANKAALTHRQKTDAALAAIFTELDNSLVELNKARDKKSIAQQQSLICDKLRKSVSSGLLHEVSINLVGYSYFRKNDLVAAECLFKCNTILFPESANTYDSYGEALEAGEKFDEAKIYYQKAVTVGEKEKHPLLGAFKENVSRVSKKLTAKK